MHEMHLLKELLADLLKHAGEQGMERISKVYLRMGEFTEINEEILRYFFKENAKGTPAEGALLEVEKSSQREICLVSFDGE